LLGLVVSTTHFRFVVDPEKKTYSECLWFLGFRMGTSTTSFDRIEYLFIKANRETQRMNLRVASSTVTKVVYDGYMKFSETDRVHIGSRGSKADLLRKLQPLATTLGVPINDYTRDATP
jgi:hypothetical protein